MRSRIKAILTIYLQCFAVSRVTFSQLFIFLVAHWLTDYNWVGPYPPNGILIGICTTDFFPLSIIINIPTLHNLHTKKLHQELVEHIFTYYFQSLSRHNGRIKENPTATTIERFIYGRNTTATVGNWTITESTATTISSGGCCCWCSGYSIKRRCRWMWLTDWLAMFHTCTARKGRRNRVLEVEGSNRLHSACYLWGNLVCYQWWSRRKWRISWGRRFNLNAKIQKPTWFYVNSNNCSNSLLPSPFGNIVCRRSRWRGWV